MSGIMRSMQGNSPCNMQLPGFNSQRGSRGGSRKYYKKRGDIYSQEGGRSYSQVGAGSGNSQEDRNTVQYSRIWNIIIKMGPILSIGEKYSRLGDFLLIFLEKGVIFSSILENMSPYRWVIFSRLDNILEYRAIFCRRSRMFELLWKALYINEYGTICTYSVYCTVFS